MRINRTFAANCAVTRASPHANFGCTYEMNNLCGFTRRGLAGVATAPARLFVDRLKGGHASASDYFRHWPVTVVNPERPAACSASWS
jgi:hypothetical protein